MSVEDVRGIVYEVDPDLRDVLDDVVSSLRRRVPWILDDDHPKCSLYDAPNPLT